MLMIMIWKESPVPSGTTRDEGVTFQTWDIQDVFRINIHFFIFLIDFL